MSSKILSFTDKLLQSELRSRVEEYVSSRTTSGPVIVEFDPTTACNFTCPECISILLLNKGQFETKRTLELIDEFYAAGVKGIIFIGGGEPLAHKSMPAPITRCHEHGMSVGLTTNGSLLHRYLEPIAQYVSWVRVSVDAATQETFSIFRPSHIANSFSKIIENMRMLANVKKGILGYSFLLMERSSNGKVITNCHEIYKAACLARELGCDYFECKPMVDENHHLIPLSQPVRELLSEQLPMLAALNTDKFQTIAPKSLNHLREKSSPDQPKSYRTCPTLEFRTVVTPKGIYPCPYKRGHENHRIGDPNVTFHTYWRSEERQTRTKQIDPSVECPFYCIRHETNVILHKLAEANEEGVNLLPYMINPSLEDVFI